MNHTKNYGLPQWELDDLIRMEDFNSAMANLESGVSDAAEAAADAQKTAENARKTSVAAFGPNHMPYAVGSYQGTGQDLFIELGFRPSFVIISGAHVTGTVDAVSLGEYNLISGGHSLSPCISFTDTGFVVRKQDESRYPKLLSTSKTYDYIAFR